MSSPVESSGSSVANSSYFAKAKNYAATTRVGVSVTTKYTYYTGAEFKQKLTDIINRIKNATLALVSYIGVAASAYYAPAYFGFTFLATTLVPTEATKYVTDKIATIYQKTSKAEKALILAGVALLSPPIIYPVAAAVILANYSVTQIQARAFKPAAV